MFALIPIALAGATFSSAPSLVKVRPAEPLPEGTRPIDGKPLRLMAARGECESVQFIATAGDAAIAGLELHATPLVRAEGGRLTASIFREAFLDITTPSNTDGAIGLWPDALVPVLDAYANEPRRAFPVDVPAHRHQPI